MKEVFIKRKELKLRQKDVAEALNISQQSYRMRENGIRDFTVPEAVRLAKFYDCTLDELFGGD